MGVCTAAQAVEAMKYFVGYCEKADGKSQYLTRDKPNFTLNAGSANYTYFGKVCGLMNGAWCAMQVSTAIYEACGNSTANAKTAMHGLWPYTACNQLYDAAPSSHKGRRGAWTPKAGDVIVFWNGSIRTHTGMVYSVDSSNVYTIEGNVSNKCQQLSYKLTDSKIYGYVRPKYSDASTTKAVATCTPSFELLEDNRKYTTGFCMTLQLLLNGKFKAGLDTDGVWGPKTKAAVIAAQKKMGFATTDQDGSVGKKTWEALGKY